MGREQLVEAFAAWSTAQGLTTRDIDRRRVLRDLFELAGSGPVEEAHIEELSKKYRQGLIGARAVLAARQVGFEILEWQAETGPAQAEPRVDEPIREQQPEEPVPVSHLSSIPPASSSLPSQSSLAALAAPAAPEAQLVSQDVWGEVQKSEPPAAPAKLLDARLLEVDKEATSKALGYDRRPSTRPPATGLSIEESIQGISEERRKLRRLENLDDKIDAGARAPSSVPPKVGDSVRPGASERPGSNRPGPASRPPSNRPPGPQSTKPPTIQLPGSTVFQSPAYAPPPAAPSRISRRMLLGGGAILAIPVLSYVFAWPRFLHANAAKVVTGPFSSKHLGVSWDFRGTWKHAEQLDDVSSIPEGQRRVSVFFQGTAHDAFTSQLTIVVFRGKSALTTENARQLGANETLGMAQNRHCEGFTASAIEGMRCSAFGSYAGKPMAVLEHYFSLGGKAVFLRTMTPFALAAPTNDLEATRRASEEQERRIDELIDGSESILETMRSLP